MTGVRFGEIHSYRDLGLALSSVEITPPEPKVYRISVAGADGDIDITGALTDGDIHNKYSEVMNAIHGKEFSEIVFDDDGNYFYTGRVSATALSSEPLKGTIIVQCVVDPYKYDWGDNWLWDPFSFETGVINEMYNLEVKGRLEVVFIGQRKKYVPTITVSSAMAVQYKDKNYSLSTGKNKIFDIKFQEGNNYLVFSGHGVISIENIGGSL